VAEDTPPPPGGTPALSVPHLPDLAAALAKAATVEQLADLLVTQVRQALGAAVAVFAVLSEDRTEFLCLRIAGCPPEVADAWRRFPADAAVPIADAVRTGRPVFLDTVGQREARYPEGDRPVSPRVGGALAAVPLQHCGAVGGLGLTFPQEGPLGEAERGALLEVGRLFGEALGRVRSAQPHSEVLAVDDEPAVLRLLALALPPLGFAVRVAGGGREAVEVYRRHRENIDLVLLDVQMPGLDGPQTLTALQAVRPDVRCAFMSGHTGRYTAEELLAMGAAHVFLKPFGPLAEFARVLREVATGER
jgi:CheY-like chemotaxis protein